MKIRTKTPEQPSKLELCMRWMPVIAVIVLTGGGALAQTAPILEPNPSECEIQAALLGRTAPGCPEIILRRPPPDVPTDHAQPENSAARLLDPVVRPTIPDLPLSPDVRLSSNFRIQFDFNAATIRPESRAVLDQIGAVLSGADAANLNFEVVGHTDAVGSDAANLRLSKRRAQAVVAYLVTEHGLPAARLKAIGMGARQPLFPDDPKASANRRVEIINLGTTTDQPARR